jgi:hypothetical protein
VISARGSKFAPILNLTLLVLIRRRLRFRSLEPGGSAATASTRCMVNSFSRRNKSVAKHVAQRAQYGRTQCSLRRLHRLPAHERQYIVGRGAPHHAVDGAKQHAPLAVNRERSRHSDAPFFVSVQQIPLAHHLPFHVAPNWKAHAQRLPQMLSALRLIHRQSDDAISRTQKCVRSVAIIRQLADAERSPLAAVENQDARSQRRQTAFLARRIWQHNLGRHITNARCAHGHTI